MRLQTLTIEKLCEMWAALRAKVPNVLSPVIGKDFHVKRLCPSCKIFNETALALGHPLYMERSPSSKNVMGHSLHRAFS